MGSVEQTTVATVGAIEIGVQQRNLERTAAELAVAQPLTAHNAIWLGVDTRGRVAHRHSTRICIIAVTTNAAVRVRVSLSVYE